MGKHFQAKEARNIAKNGCYPSIVQLRRSQAIVPLFSLLKGLDLCLCPQSFETQANYFLSLPVRLSLKVSC